MTEPTKSRASPKTEAMPLYPTERRLVQEIFGASASPDIHKMWDGVAVILERQGLPKRDPLFSNRRYWPAVDQFLRRRNGLSSVQGGFTPDGEENWT